MHTYSQLVCQCHCSDIMHSYICIGHHGSSGKLWGTAFRNQEQWELSMNFDTVFTSSPCFSLKKPYFLIKYFKISMEIFLYILGVQPLIIELHNVSLNETSRVISEVKLQYLKLTDDLKNQENNLLPNPYIGMANIYFKIVKLYSWKLFVLYIFFIFIFLF